MSEHADLGPELRALAQSILDRIDPAVRAAAAAASRADGQGKCQQVWCPVCALAALVNGEQHPLLTVVRTMVEGIESTPGPDRPPPAGPGPSRYEHSPVTVEE